MWAFLAGIAPLFLMLYKEYCSAEAKAQAEDKAFNLDQAILKTIVESAVSKWNDANESKTKEAANAWDAADSDADSNIDPTKKNI